MVATQTFRAPEYAYDPLRRRIQFIDSVNTVTKRYYLDGNQVVDERDAGANRQRYYVWGNYIDELLMFNDDADDDSDYVVCHDQLYSAQALLAKTDGSIAERYDYDAYGKPMIYTATGAGGWWDGNETSAAASAKDLPYLFTGREFDPLDGAALKLQYSRARYYSFNLRRWLQRDSIGYVDGMSLYEYVKSRPTQSLDPSGLLKSYCGCTNAEKKILKADALRAKQSIEILLGDIERAIAADIGEYPAFTGMKLSRAKSILECATGKLDSLGSKCEQTGGQCGAATNAWVNWIFATRIHICPKYFSPSRSPSNRSRTLIHEATHACGTFDGKRSPDFGTIIGWHDNAYTYGWWVDNHFCIPGYDCPE